MSNNASMFDRLSAQREMIERDPSLRELFRKLEIAVRTERHRTKLTPAQFTKEPIHPVVKACFDELQGKIIERAVAEEKARK